MQRKEPRDIRDFQRQRLYDAENRVAEGGVWDSLAAAQS
jgi:putative metallohydrolase (TIGR04338 family)